MAIMVGTGKAAEMGILIKSAESLETLHAVDTVVLDKTGTITSGRPSVTDVIMLDSALPEQTFLEEAAAAETGSEHPLAQAVVERAKSLKLSLPKAEGFAATAGRGVEAVVRTHTYLAGNLAFMEENGMLGDSGPSAKAKEIVKRFAEEGKTPLLFARDRKLAGVVAVADTIRDSSRAAIRRFTEMGLHVVMLTGDNRATAEAIRKQLGIETAISDVLPTEKEANIRALQMKGKKVAMVGDGINDAPALTRADVGIAIGAGTDIAIDSADVVLMKDSLYDVATAIGLSRAVIRNIHMNLFWAFFYNVLGIPVAAGVLYPAFGLLLSPMLGSAAMSLSSVCVVLNALRLRFFKRKEAILTGQAGVKPIAPKSASRSDQTDTIKKKEGVTMKKVLKVDGMMCAHCQMHVEKALAAVDGVQKAEVDLAKKQAAVSLLRDVPDQKLMDAVSQAGYTPIECITE